MVVMFGMGWDEMGKRNGDTLNLPYGFTTCILLVGLGGW